MRFMLAALVVAPAFLRPQVGHADEVDEAVKHGVELRRQGQDEAALFEFRRAAAIRRTLRVDAQMGLAEDALGLWAAAEKDLGEALRSHDDPWIELHRSTLEQALASVQTKLGSLFVSGQPSGARVYVNGALVGSLPIGGPLRVAAGWVRLKVEADGYPSLTRQLQVQSGSDLREQVNLVAPTTPRVSLPETPKEADSRSHSIQDGGSGPPSAWSRRAPVKRHREVTPLRH